MKRIRTFLHVKSNRGSMSNDSGFVKVIGFLLFFVGLIANVLIVNQDGVNIHYFLDAVVIMAMGIPICSVVVATGEADFFVKAIKSVFSKKIELTKEEAKNAINLFLLLRKTTVLSAIIPIMIDVIRVLADPEITVNPVSFVLVPVLYATFIVMALLNPAIYTFNKRLDAFSVNENEMN